MNEERLKKLLEWEAQKPEDAFLKFALSQEYVSAGDDSTAKKYLELLADNFPDYLAPYYQLGKLYERTGETEKAKTIYLKGKAVAQSANDLKTLRELNEAINLLEDE